VYGHLVGTVAGCTHDEAPLFHVPANGRLTLFAFDKGVSAGIPFGEPRETRFQQIPPHQTHYQQIEPRQARFQQKPITVFLA
jgi:hypothetical protein